MKKNNNIIFSLFILLIIISGCEEHQSIHLDKKIIKKIYPAIVEVVTPKKEDKNIEYARELPFDKLDYMQRNDKFHAIGTAFFIEENKLISAAHVFNAQDFSTRNSYFIRTKDKKVYPIKTIYKYSTYRDVIEFDLKQAPKNIRPIELSAQVEIGDMVYAVGNAQGQGISTRGGQVSTFTPEPTSGDWNFIRFSSPASPGNSGGPLVNAKGQAIGIIVMKNNSENLNFALPITELNITSSKEAHFYERQLKIQDGMQVHTKDWQFKTKLPSNFQMLQELAMQSLDVFYKRLINDFKEKFHELIFPHHHRFRDSLLYQNPIDRLSIIDKDQALHNWRLSEVALKRIVVDENNILFHAKGDIFKHFVLFKANDKENSLALINNPRLLLNRLLIASGANRYLAGQRIPILDHGEPNETTLWRDRLGRAWKSSHWITQYNDSLISSHCSPTPEGVYCFVDHDYASQMKQGYMEFVKENILEVNMSYKASPKQWDEFLKLPSQYKPTVFESLKINIKENKMNIISKEFKVKNRPIGSRSILDIYIGHKPGKMLSPMILAIKHIFDQSNEKGLALMKIYENDKLAPVQYRDRWNNVIKRVGVYTKRPIVIGRQWKTKGPIGKKLQEDLLKLVGVKQVQSQWVFHCFTPASHSFKAALSHCNNIKDNIVISKNQ